MEFYWLDYWFILPMVNKRAGGSPILWFSDAGLYSLSMSVYGIFFPIAQYRMYTYQVSDVNGENTVGEYLSFRLLTILFITCFDFRLFAIYLSPCFRVLHFSLRFI